MHICLLGKKQASGKLDEKVLNRHVTYFFINLYTRRQIPYNHITGLPHIYRSPLHLFYSTCIPIQCVYPETAKVVTPPENHELPSQKQNLNQQTSLQVQSTRK